MRPQKTELNLNIEKINFFEKNIKLLKPFLLYVLAPITIVNSVLAIQDKNLRIIFLINVITYSILFSIMNLMERKIKKLKENEIREQGRDTDAYQK